MNNCLTKKTFPIFWVIFIAVVNHIYRCILKETVGLQSAQHQVQVQEQSFHLGECLAGTVDGAPRRPEGMLQAFISKLTAEQRTAANSSLPFAA